MPRFKPSPDVRVGRRRPGLIISGILLLVTYLIPEQACGQDWYIPKRYELLKRGNWELGSRLQLAANNDGLLNTTTWESVYHVRLTPLRRLEAYLEIPLVHKSKEDVQAFSIVSKSTSGLGDMFTQFSFEGFSGSDWKTIFNLDIGWPTGKNPYENTVGLGGGHYSLAIGQTTMKVIDPLVMFFHIGYQHSFARTFKNTGKVAPGDDLRFRIGTSLSLNPKVTATVNVSGDILSGTKLAGTTVAGSSDVLVRLGLGFDWLVGRRTKWGADAIFGMTDNSGDATVIVNWSLGF